MLSLSTYTHGLDKAAVNVQSGMLGQGLDVRQQRHRLSMESANIWVAGTFRPLSSCPADVPISSRYADVWLLHSALADLQLAH